MNEISNKTQQELANRKTHILNFFKQNVCDNMKIYVLGGTKVERHVRSVGDYVMYINNILSLAFVFAYGCLRCDNDSDEPISEGATKQSSLRILNSLRKAYVQYPVTSELIQFVLSDIQFEMLNGNDSELYEVFEKLCTFKSKDFSLAKYYKLIASWRAAPSRFNMDSNELAGLFQKMLEEMTFLKEYELVCEDGSFWFINKDAMGFGKYGSFDRIPASHLIYYDPDLSREMYTLYSIERLEENDEKTLGLQYVSSNGLKAITFTVSENEPEDEALAESHITAEAEDFYYEIIGEEWDFDTEDKNAKKKDDFIDHVHAINYKYIKNLALSISDAISVNMGSKKALYNAFHIRHKDVFGKISPSDDIEYLPLDWDGIIVMLLIESSPTSVLEALFKAVPQTFITIAKNLCKRIDNPDMPIHGLSDRKLREKVNEIIKTKLILGETGGFGKITRNHSSERLYARAASSLIISSLSAILEEESVEKSICAGNLYDNISLLKKIKNDENAEQKGKYVSIILGETFRHLTCFYKGLLEYGEIKGRFDAESCNCCFSESKIASYQKQMQTAFMEAAKNEAEQLKQYNPANYKDMIALLHKFIALCEQCSASSRSSSAEGYKLYFAIGRHEILNINVFKRFSLECINSLSEINEVNVDSWISFALDILHYLRAGKLKGNADSPTDAIYPFTATYNRGNENYDGYKTVTFVLNINLDGDGDESKEYINVLTEFSYNLSNDFYCLPNVLRSNRKWWIDPVLINFKEFNEIFDEAELGE